MSVVENNLPSTWTLCKLGDVMKLRNGYAFKSKDYSDEGVPLIRISDINDSVVSIAKAAKIPVDLVHEGYLIEDGDLLIAMSGATTGKTGVYKGKDKVLQNQRVGNFKIIDESVVSREYRDYYVMSLRKAIEGAAYGGAQPNIAAKDIDEFPFPLAPLEQQKRIVAKIEELFSHIDAGIEALNKAKKLLKQYRQSVLKAAVTGELTKEWREQNKDKLEPASQLLERILQERRQKWEEQQLEQFKAKGKILKNDKWKEKYKEPNNKPEKFFEEPEGWGWAEIGTITDMLSGHAFKKSEYSEKGIRLFQIANVSFGHTKWDEVEHLPEEYLEKWQHLSLDEGDILMALNRPLLSKQLKISRLSKSDVPAILYQRVGKFQFYSECISDYFLIYMQSHYYINRLEEQLQGVNIPFINKGKLLETPISVPGSIEEMDLIVEQVNSKLESIQRMNDEINFQLKKAEKNKQSILASAFSGSLVDNSLPVSDVNELLGAIKAQKQGGAKPRKSKQPAKVEENRALEEIITESFGDKEFTIEQLLQISTNGDEAKLKNELFEIIKKCSVKSSKLEMSFNEDMEAYVFRLYKGELG